MKKYLWLLLPLLLIPSLAFGQVSSNFWKLVNGSFLVPVIGSWSIGSTSVNGFVNNFTINGTCTGCPAGSGTTTINGVNGPTFTFASGTDTNVQLQISTSSGQVLFTPIWAGLLGNNRIASSSYFFASSTQVIAGAGLSGGGTLTGNVTLTNSAPNNNTTTTLTGGQNINVSNGGVGATTVSVNTLFTTSTITTVTSTLANLTGINYTTATGTTENVTGTSTFATTNGRVGIALKTPSSTLDVNGNVSIGTYAGGTAAPSNGLIVSGAVGIGTSSPEGTASLHIEKDQNGLTNLLVQNATAGTGALVYIRVAEDTNNKQFQLIHLNTSYTTNGVLAANTSYMDSLDSGGLYVGSRNASGKVAFFTGGLAASNERMRIDSSGNVGIASTTPGYTLSVAGTLGVSALGTAGTGDNSVCLNGNQITQNAATTCLVSSKWFKHNIATLNTGMNDFMKLNPVSYLENGTNKPNAGFVAEEVAKINPVLAENAKKDEVTDGHLFKAGDPKSINIAAILATTVKAVQDMWVTVTSHDDRIRKLEQDNLRLQKEIDALNAKVFPPSTTTIPTP